MSSPLWFLEKMRRGNRGEAEVVEAITRLLRSPEDAEDNFFLTTKLKIPGLSGPRELDVVLLHPSLGIFVIEVKNWSSLDCLNDDNNPFDQVVHNQQLMINYIKDALGQLPINVEGRVIFPAISREKGEAFFEDRPNLEAYRAIAFFKEDIHNRTDFRQFFISHAPLVPKKKDFMKVAELLVSKKHLKAAEDRILPVITRDEVVFFDYKQLSILDGYQGGFRIIRGVAGTGKTVILTNFVANRVRRDPTDKFLVLVFNTRLQQAIQADLAPYRSNVAVCTLWGMLERVGFDFHALDPQWDTLTFSERMSRLSTPAATAQFQLKLRARLQRKPIDYVLCDEVQDMPANIMRVLYEEVRDVIYFVDEAQRFFDYSMHSIADVFHHPEFERLSMRGRVKNLKNVYRTPSNIAQAAFSILSLDRALNAYYKKAYYLKEGFLSDVNFILQEGRLQRVNWERYSILIEQASRLAREGQTIILTPFSQSQQRLQAMLVSKGLDDRLQVMTYQSVKGLEADNIILHDFDGFLEKVLKYEPDMLYRKVYVLMTRAIKQLYLSADWEALRENETLQPLVEIIEGFETASTSDNDEPARQEPALAKLKPTLQNIKENTELIVAASELFALVAGLFTVS